MITRAAEVGRYLLIHQSGDNTVLSFIPFKQSPKLGGEQIHTLLKDIMSYASVQSDFHRSYSPRGNIAAYGAKLGLQCSSLALSSSVITPDLLILIKDDLSKDLRGEG